VAVNDVGRLIPTIGAETAVPTGVYTPAGLVITGGSRAEPRIWIVIFVEEVPDGLVAVTIGVNTPTEEGTPEMSPVVALTVSPSGRPVAT
jgi:hypothetical protein